MRLLGAKGIDFGGKIIIGMPLVAKNFFQIKTDVALLALHRGNIHLHK